MNTQDLIDLVTKIQSYHLAKTDVIPAKKAEANAKTIHISTLPC